MRIFSFYFYKTWQHRFGGFEEIDGDWRGKRGKISKCKVCLFLCSPSPGSFSCLNAKNGVCVCILRCRYLNFNELKYQKKKGKEYERKKKDQRYWTNVALRFEDVLYWCVKRLACSITRIAITFASILFFKQLNCLHIPFTYSRPVHDQILRQFTSLIPHSHREALS